jgi:hypothetical protein
LFPLKVNAGLPGSGSMTMLRYLTSNYSLFLVHV